MFVCLSVPTCYRSVSSWHFAAFVWNFVKCNKGQGLSSQHGLVMSAEGQIYTSVLELAISAEAQDHLCPHEYIQKMLNIKTIYYHILCKPS